MPDDWRDRRGQAATDRAAALERQRAQETAAARELIAGFLATAAERGLAAVPLRARSYDGRRRFRTGLQGWYLRANQSVAIDTEGRFYLLSVPGAGPLAMLRGVAPEESDPPLVLGRGARDGESIDLADALARVLGA